MRNPVTLCLLMALAGCGDNGNNSDGGGGPPGGGTGMFPPGGITFPWPVYDGTVPDTPEASGGGQTWYVDGANGSDSADGASFATAKKTISAVLASVHAGDTVLIAGGVYRERPNVGSLNGAPGKPITFGSYGRGTGAPIIDGGEKPNTWTKVSGTVWKSSTAGLGKLASNPVLGIYVNSGKSEFALREVAHGQLASYGSDPLPSGQTQANVVDNSNLWFFDKGAQIVYADFGGTLGSADPNGADVSLLYRAHEPLLVLSLGHDYFTFVGLTLRAGSWTALYSEVKGVTVDHCDVKFNGGGGIAFDASSGDPSVTDNKITNSRIWMNVLDNWPRFNNGNATGGWPGGISWYSQSNGLAEGNVVYQNGGEGVVVWGTNASNGTPHSSMNNHVRHNIVFDNWSVNIYLDNTQQATIEQNFVFDHPRDETMTFDNLLNLSTGYRTDWSKRLTPVSVSLADEPGSAADSHAHLSDITVINNIFVGGKFGFVDYDDGTSAPFHGLRNCVIANNTWVLGTVPVTAQSGFGWRHLFADGGNPDNSSNSIIENNIFAVSSGDNFVQAGKVGAGPGITNDYNLYSGPGQFSVASDPVDYAAWLSGHPTWDQHSIVGEAMLTDVSEFDQTLAQKLVYDWAKAVPLAGSPAFGAGTGQQFTTDFTGAHRSGNDLGAVAKH